MTSQHNAFMERLLATFRVEAQEHINALFTGLVALEQTLDPAQQAEWLETIFREAHSLKGAARSVSLTQIETACQSLENRFAAMKRHELVPSRTLFDQLNQEIRQIDNWLSEQAASPPPQPPAFSAATTELPPAARTATPSPPAAEDKPALASTIRIASDKLGTIFLQVEEMLAAKLLAQQRKQDFQAIQAATLHWAKTWASTLARDPDFQREIATRPQWQALLDQNTDFIKSTLAQLNGMVKAADQDQRQLARMVDELLDDMKQALMLPFSTVLELFPRLVRDIAGEHGKDIELVIQGSELEADRRILEAIKDPLIHLVRNCIDHGIEPPAIRVQQNKPARGKISVLVTARDGNRVEIALSDDGAGIDAAGLRDTAVQRGLMAQDEAGRLSEAEAFELIYRSGFSTSPIITEISGRGLGLAIVRDKIEKLGGNITLETAPGAGTCFRILLPLTLATYRGIIVRIGEQQFVLPTTHVALTLRTRKENIRTLENRECVQINGESLAVYRLGDVLGVTHHSEDAAPHLQMAVLTANGKRMAFVVDEVLNEQEVLVKSLGRQLARVRNIAAATILGSGRVVPILNVADVMKSALQATAPARQPPAGGKATAKHVLVVEDSITARSLLKGILEMAGYRVSTAVDGMDGLTRVRSGQFDIVVSDVEMPRMDGFDLTARIRGDKKLSELPVILVTALESREDRERGIEVGANAYIVKHGFEQGNLLEIMRRLL